LILLEEPKAHDVNDDQRQAEIDSWTSKAIVVAGALLTLAGYWGPWVNHDVAGLVVTGLDLGEYVKFLEPVRSGSMRVWREGFYLPLVAVSLSLSLTAFRWRSWLVRILLLAVAVVAALNMLPPAWTPQLMLTAAEFRLQTVAIGICTAAALFCPFLALIPKRWAGGAMVLLVLLAIWFPVSGFLHVLPAISEIYNRPLWAGWGMYALIVGLLLLGTGAALQLFHGRKGK
jgi:hypothetical protein